MEIVEVFYFDKEGRELDKSVTTEAHAKKRIGEWIHDPHLGGKTKIARFEVISRSALKAKRLCEVKRNLSA